MTEPTSTRRSKVEQALKSLAKLPLVDGFSNLLAGLGYQSDKTTDLGSTATEFVGNLKQFSKGSRELDATKAALKDWTSCALLFQLTNDEIPSLMLGQQSFSIGGGLLSQQIESFVFLGIELKGEDWSRTALATITRELNRQFPMPAIVLFRYAGKFSLAVIDRRSHKRDATRDVLTDRISIIKDVRLDKPHSAHVHILASLAVDALGESNQRPDTFAALYKAWLDVLSVQELNKRFYRELACWYFWATQEVRFPDGAKEKVAVRNATSVIRLITRLIFVWFIKERGLVPSDLFELPALKEVLKQAPDTAPEESTYYKAILQNLFFATLNMEMGEKRRFRGKNKSGGRDPHYGIHNVYRYEDAFQSSEAALALFKEVPFLNGGLFECLDKLAEDKGSKTIVRIDGFSDRADNTLKVPNKLFFSDPIDIDLNDIFDTRNKRYTARGLLNILESYKFTVDENTPVEQEVALDPELLGKVFENLLASYNPETSTTARKQTGSFYTPREIVDYMVDESLFASFSETLKAKDGNQDEGICVQLRTLLSYADTPHGLAEADVKKLITVIDSIKVLDPACGSGAFPMGMLLKLVHVLAKLDPRNEKWKQRQVDRVNRLIVDAEDTIEADDVKRSVVADLEKQRTDVEEAFLRNQLDYGRKLYLIQNCIFGVDIQPIAVQIAKLRFFISLIVNETIDSSRTNRGIRPLPNLETKFVAANSLISIENNRQATLQSYVHETIRIERDLRRVRERHFHARTQETKDRCRAEDARLRAELAVLLEQDGYSPTSARLLAHWNPYDLNRVAGFFDPKWMFEVDDGFDIVIGNPPYIKEFTSREAFDGVRDSPYYQGKMDIWYLFACKALDQLRSQAGVLCFIATNNWVTNAGASVMRAQVARRATMLQLIDFVDYKIFGSADIQTMILLLRNESIAATYSFDLRRLNKPGATFEDVEQLLTRLPNEGMQYLCPSFERDRFSSATYTFATDGNEQVLDWILKRSNFRFDSKLEIAQGIVAPQDFANKKAVEILEGSAEVGEGIFILSDIERSTLKLDKAEKDLTRPYFTTEELGRYTANKQNKYWVIYTGSEFKTTVAMRPYPVLKQHLDRFREVITSDNAPYGLHRARDERFFIGEKIISLRKCAAPTFTYTDFDCYVSQTFNVIKTPRLNQLYLTGLLNSTVVAFWLRHRGKMQGHLFQVDKEPLLSIPIYQPPKAQQDLIAGIAKAIIASKRAGNEKAAHAARFEQLINGLIYELYFPEPLQSAGINLIELSAKEGLAALGAMEGAALAERANELAEHIFSSQHPIRGLLFDLQGIPVVRLIEGRE